MKKMLSLILIVILIGLMFSCAGPNTLEKTANAKGKIAGFWSGLWNGLLIMPTFVISLFSPIHFYNVHNNGGWYNLGFMLGMIPVVGGMAKATPKRKKKSTGNEK